MGKLLIGKLIKINELNKMEDFQSYKEIEDVEQFRISCKKVDKNGAQLVARALKNLMRFQVIFNSL